ncbi:hypothetical protein SAMN05444374_10660 [Rhodococcoides kroppenstedtii]|uniref:Uncharacterized protein n=1 Tax=Rhodococcoides kroppenstedtii TaxID=293050 RepID=A0A1I0THL3_9NOCA|nr:hypothetical protein [Rhodococcus kroppenstedtii]SFA50476.1 hypothetical protein SAMN05444374_10660 [Rhodococcus kroppenstedtii]
MTVRWVDAVVIVIAVAVGVAAVIAGGADDSPGLQGLGLIVVIGSVALAVRRARRRRHGGHRPRD